MTNTYILTGKKLPGHLELKYCEGDLNGISLAFKERLTEDLFRILIDNIPFKEDRIAQLSGIGFNIKRQIAANEKIDLFCRVYEKYKLVKYKVSAMDSGKIKLISINDQMLEFYFSTDNFLFKGKHSISNLVKYYNELLAAMAAPPKSKHPDHFSRQYQDRLTPEQCSDYWKHLHNLGLKPLKVRGVTTDWVKANNH